MKPIRIALLAGCIATGWLTGCGDSPTAPPPAKDHVVCTVTPAPDGNFFVTCTVQ